MKDKNCPKCEHVYMYEIIHEELTWSHKFIKQWLRCMFCDRIECKTIHNNKPLGEVPCVHCFRKLQGHPLF